MGEPEADGVGGGRPWMIMRLKRGVRGGLKWVCFMDEESVQGDDVVGRW